MKSISRKFRKFLAKNGKPFPLSGAFSLKISGKEVTDPSKLPASLGNKKVEVLPGVLPTPVKTKKPDPVATLPERPLFKRIVVEADPEKGKRRRVSYKQVNNPKGGETYFAKIDGKYHEVPAAYADPMFELTVADAA